MTFSECPNFTGQFLEKQLCNLTPSMLSHLKLVRKGQNCPPILKLIWSSIITRKILKKFVKFWTWFFLLLYVLSPVFVYVRQNMSTRADLRGLWRLIITCQLPILQKIRKILNLTFPPLLSHFAGQLLAGFCLCQNWSKYVEKS